jgi:tetratricopeptide (TPR) repeat protein
LVAPPLDIPTYEVSAHFDSSSGILAPAPTKIDIVYRDDTALALNAVYSPLTVAARDQILREFWKEQYSFVDVKTSSASFNKDSRELRLTMTGDAQIDWSDGTFALEGSRLGFKADFKRPSGQLQNAPFDLSHPTYTKITYTFIVPPGAVSDNATKGPDFHQTLAGTEYGRHTQFVGNILTVEASTRTLVPEISYQQALADEKALRDLFDQVAWMRVPSGYRYTNRDIAAQIASKPTTAREFIRRGNILLDGMRLGEALADFNQALALEPKNDIALANRAITYFWKRDLAAAEKDLDAASKINARNAIVFRARGLMAEDRSEYREAVDAFSTSLEIQSNNAFALSHRAQNYLRLGEKDRALADATAALANQPRSAELRLMRGNLYAGRGQKDLSLAEADWLVEMMKDDSYAQVAAAAIYENFGRKDAAAKAIDRALAIKPEAYIYLNRTRHRPKSDFTGRLADIDAALKLEPENVDGIGLKAEILGEKGQHPAAIELYNEAIAANPKLSWLKVRRGVAYLRTGRSEDAAKDFTAFRNGNPSATDLNGSCWIKATAGVALESALADCDAALRLSPGNSAYLDSRGLVLLRLGRFDEAIDNYNQAIAKEPRGISYMGRAMAWSHKGDRGRAEADRQAAMRIDERSLQFPDDIGLKF